MATPGLCLAHFSRLSLSSSARQSISHLPQRTLAPAIQIRHAAFKQRILSKSEKAGILKGPQRSMSKNKKKGEKDVKKRKPRTTYKQPDLKQAQQFSLCDAMRYIRAFEVGRSPTSIKYELAVKLKSLKNGPIVRNRLRLPHPVKTDIRICVICPPNSKHAELARAAGATLIGEDDVIEAIKAGKVDFDRCICQTDSLMKMNKAGLGRILGPRGLMPSTKMGTVVKDPAQILKDLIGGAEYRERLGVIRLAIGQLGFTPEELQKNVKTLIEALKKDMALMSDKISKELTEVVLSSTNSPGFSLNGDFRDLKSDIKPEDMARL